MIFFNILIFFWIIISVKQILFWIYLWQLKEYHIPRFLDHFRTAKGRDIIFNKLRIAKIILLFLFLADKSFFYILAVIYFAEFLLLAQQIVNKSFKKPRVTGKSAVIVLLCLVIVFLFLTASQNPIDLLAFDIILPIIVSVIVLTFQNHTYLHMVIA
jgi:hypothetical protein